MKGQAQERTFGFAMPNNLFVMRYSYCDRFIKIGSSPDVEAHRASLRDGQNFHVEVLATFGGQGHLAESVRKLLEPKRSGQGACDHWFSASLGEALESIRQAIDNDQHACEMQASISNTNADISASVPANPAWFSKKAPG